MILYWLIDNHLRAIFAAFLNPPELVPASFELTRFHLMEFLIILVDVSLKGLCLQVPSH